MNKRPKILDAFCCQGGAGKGYADAGFDVTGVDIDPQPRYPYRFVQADAIAFILEHGAEFDFIHASPPCQHYTKARNLRKNNHPDLIGPTRAVLKATGRPWVIENVEDAADWLNNPVRLCGAAFGLRTYRHRLFETGNGFLLPEPMHPEHSWPLVKMGRPPVPGHFNHYVGHFSGADQAREDLGTPWMTKEGMRECIPPAYTRYVGQHLMHAVRRQQGAEENWMPGDRGWTA